MSESEQISSPIGALTVLEVADDPESWTAAGFDVVGNQMMLDGVMIRFSGAGSAGASRGICGWHLADVSAVGGNLDGLAHVAGAGTALPEGQNQNGIDGIDHLVVATPHLVRTIALFNDVGLHDRRTRTFQVGDTERQQTFFWAGDTIIEMIGIPGEVGDEPASFWGLALVSSDLDATAESLGEHISTPKDAVQRGRRIATIKTKELDISVPIAVMTPHGR